MRICYWARKTLHFSVSRASKAHVPGYLAKAKNPRRFCLSVAASYSTSEFAPDDGTDNRIYFFVLLVDIAKHHHDADNLSNLMMMPYYRSIPGKRPQALYHNSLFFTTLGAYHVPNYVPN